MLSLLFSLSNLSVYFIKPIPNYQTWRFFTDYCANLPVLQNNAQIIIYLKADIDKIYD